MTITWNFSKRGEVISFIATYIFENPGCKMIEACKAIAIEKGDVSKWKSYSRYFTTSWTVLEQYRYAGRYWVEVEEGNNQWILTTEGMGLVRIAESESEN